MMAGRMMDSESVAGKGGLHMWPALAGTSPATYMPRRQTGMTA